MNINEIIYYLKSQYSADSRDQIIFIQDIPNQEDIPFEAISEDLKAILKFMKEDENMSLKISFYLVGGYQLQRRHIDMIKLKKGRICLIDLKTGYIESEK